MFFCLVMSVGKRKKTWVPMRNWTSDLQILCSISVPLSHRDSMVGEVYYKVHMTCFQHTARISNVNSVKFVNRIKETISFEFGKEMEKDVFLSCHKCGSKKKMWVPIRNQTSDLRKFHTLLLYHWATQTLWWARSIMKFSEWRSLCLI